MMSELMSLVHLKTQTRMPISAKGLGLSGRFVVLHGVVFRGDGVDFNAILRCLSVLRRVWIEVLDLTRHAWK